MPYALGGCVGLALISALLGWLLLDKTEELGAVTAKANAKIESLANAAGAATADATNVRERMVEHRDAQSLADSQNFALAIENERLKGEINANREQRFLQALADPYGSTLDDDVFFDGLRTKQTDRNARHLRGTRGVDVAPGDQAGTGAADGDDTDHESDPGGGVAGEL